MRLFRVLLGTGLVAAAALMGFQMTGAYLAASTGDKSGAVQVQADPIPVLTEPAQEMSFADSVEAVGTSRAHRAVVLFSQANGRIDHIAFSGGEKVSKGAVILTLENGAEQAALKSAAATLTEARASFERQQRLQSSGSTSEATLEAARAGLLRAEAESDMAAVALDDLILRAPFDGVLGMLDLSPGQLIKTTDELTTLDDLSRIEVDFRIPERHMARVALGLKVQLTSAAWPGRIFEGEISAIDTRVDPDTRSIGLRALIDNSDGALAPGMFIEVTLVLSNRDAIAVPERALTVSGDRSYINVIRDGHAVQLDIVPGQSLNGLIEVAGGDLTPGTPVIVSNLQRLRDGVPVRDESQVQAGLVAEATE
jgi:membrane fusion protein (multidrug efflux system)